MLVYSSKKRKWVKFCCCLYICSYIFSYLKNECIKRRGYSLEDLKYICSAMGVMYDEFDPTLFVNDSDSYIKKLLEFEKN